MHENRTVQVKQINGNVTTIQVNPDVSNHQLIYDQVSITDFKQIVSDKTGVPVSEMRLIYKAKQLINDSKLSEYSK